mmetsp:Transcript_2787/g.8330  ORF Transcript_2787/g.8330 Transcript_2787/m.8330 type:complete len:286 (-) Transcript_2787:2294-3151(-)
MESAWFLASTRPRRFLSSSANCSAFWTILSTSSDGSVDAPVILISCCLPVPLSVALTDRIPLASMSNLTSICGTPRGAGGMPSSLKVPRDLLSLANSRSPWRTLISTDAWLSAAVEKVSVLEVGSVVFLGMTLVATPPSVSSPRDRGVTSRRTMSDTSPARTPPWTAAPRATTSSGLTVMFAFLPVIFSTSSTTDGMRVEPPTRIISSSSLMPSLASFRAASTGILQRVSRSLASCSNWARVRVVSMCLGPSAVAVMNGRETDVWEVDESSILAFSAASVSLWSA